MESQKLRHKIEENYPPLPTYSQEEKCIPRPGTMIASCMEYNKKICLRTCKYAIERDKEEENTQPSKTL